MLFFLLILGALALWAVIAAVVAATRDGRGTVTTLDTRPHPELSPEERRADHALLTDAYYFTR